MGAGLSAISLRAIAARLGVAFWLTIMGGALPDAALSQPPAPNETPAQPDQQRLTETPALVIDGSAAQSLLGKPVQSTEGKDIGRVVDVIVDRSGILRAAVIDFGGFLGVGTRKIAVDWHVLHFPESGPMNVLVADLQRDQLRNAPVYREGEPVVVIGAANSAPAPAPAPSEAPVRAAPAPASPPPQ